MKAENRWKRESAEVTMGVVKMCGCGRKQESKPEGKPKRGEKRLTGSVSVTMKRNVGVPIAESLVLTWERSNRMTTLTGRSRSERDEDITDDEMNELNRLRLLSSINDSLKNMNWFGEETLRRMAALVSSIEGMPAAGAGILQGIPRLPGCGRGVGAIETEVMPALEWLISLNEVRRSLRRINAASPEAVRRAAEWAAGRVVDLKLSPEQRVCAGLIPMSARRIANALIRMRDVKSATDVRAVTERLDKRAMTQEAKAALEKKLKQIDEQNRAKKAKEEAEQKKPTQRGPDELWRDSPGAII